MNQSKIVAARKVQLPRSKELAELGTAQAVAAQLRSTLSWRPEADCGHATGPKPTLDELERSHESYD